MILSSFIVRMESKLSPNRLSSASDWGVDYMEPALNLLRQRDMGDRIATALERLSLAFRVLLWDVAKQEGLSPIQIQFLVYLMTHPEERRRVGNLANEFGLTPATVSDAVKSLAQKGLLYKKPWRKDKRFYNLELTPSGKSLAAEISDWRDVIREEVESFPLTVKEAVMIFLMELIESLHRAGVIKVARMCISCGNFRRDAHPGSEKPHHCSLTDTPLGVSELEVDCDMHKSN